MTDDFGSLRQAMSDLSEHGGSTDMYERSLRKSRQSQRRMALTASAAAAAGVFAIGAIAFATVGRPNPSTPVAGRPPVSSVDSTSTAQPSSSAQTSGGPQDPACPSTKILGELVELPMDWSFASSGVDCAEGWAAASVKRPASDNTIYLFHYATGTGWRYHDEGGGWTCKDLGITGPAPFCVS